MSDEFTDLPGVGVADNQGEGTDSGAAVEPEIDDAKLIELVNKRGINLNLTNQGKQMQAALNRDAETRRREAEKALADKRAAEMKLAEAERLLRSGDTSPDTLTTLAANYELADMRAKLEAMEAREQAAQQREQQWQQWVAACEWAAQAAGVDPASLAEAINSQSQLAFQSALQEAIMKKTTKPASAEPARTVKPAPDLVLPPRGASRPGDVDSLYTELEPLLKEPTKNAAKIEALRKQINQLRS